MTKCKVERAIGGNVLSIETGKVARQASGAALVRYGDTVVLAGLGLRDRVWTAGQEFQCALFVSDYAHPAFRRLNN